MKIYIGTCQQPQISPNNNAALVIPNFSRIGSKANPIQPVFSVMPLRKYIINRIGTAIKGKGATLSSSPRMFETPMTKRKSKGIKSNVGTYQILFFTLLKSIILFSNFLTATQPSCL